MSIKTYGLPTLAKNGPLERKFEIDMMSLLWLWRKINWKFSPKVYVS